MRDSRNISNRIMFFLGYFVLTVIAVICVIPLLWAISTALRPASGVLRFPPVLFPKVIRWENIPETFAMAPLGRFTFNTIFVSLVGVTTQLIFSSLAAYSFARMHYPGRNFFFLLLLSSMMVPAAVTLVPLYLMMNKLGLIDTYLGLFAPRLFGNAFGIFLFRQFFLTIPSSLEEAATIDGCGHMRIFTQIIAPISKQAFLTVGLITLMQSWNDLIWPMIIVNSENMKTLAVGIATTFQSIYGTKWVNLMVASIYSILPLIVIYFIGQKHFIESIQMTGLK